MSEHRGRHDRHRAPSLATLLDWVEGRLDPRAAELVSRAVATGDEATRESVAWVHAFHAAARELPLEAPPAGLSARLHGALDRLHDPAAGGRWSEAHPAEQGPVLPAAAGFRGVGRADAAHLVLHSRLGDLLLRVEPAGPGELDLDGRVVLDPPAEPTRGTPDPSPGTDAGTEVSLMAAGVLRGAARCRRDDGRFELRGVREDVDEVWVAVGTERVRAAVDLRDLW